MQRPLGGRCKRVGLRKLVDCPADELGAHPYPLEAVGCPSLPLQRSEDVMSEREEPASPLFTVGNPAYANHTQFGMTLRDYFAGQVIASLTPREHTTVKNDAEMAYEYADAMLEARKTKP